MLITYPALFYYEDEGFFVHFPDFKNSATQGESVEEALKMASEWLGINCADVIEGGEKLPIATQLNSLSLEGNDPFKEDEEFNYVYDKDKSFMSLVYVDINDFLRTNELVKKTLSIPSWANELGIKHGINFSQLLTGAIINETIDRS